jgi:hypothetical protein
VDQAVIEAAHAAVSAGRAANLSSWVNEALHRHAEYERRMGALDDFLAYYEAEHGPVSDEEIRDASRRARAGALVVRGARRVGPAPVKRQRRQAGRK